MPAGYQGVHCIRREVYLAGPGDCAAIDEDLLEKIGVTQRFEDTGQVFEL
jgi:hypothetical protein